MNDGKRIGSLMKKIGVLLPTRSQFPVNDRYTVDNIIYMSCEQKALQKNKNYNVVKKKYSFNFFVSLKIS
jgi:hypothetical protein